MNGVDAHQESLKRRWDEKRPYPPPPPASFGAGRAEADAVFAAAPSTSRRQLLLGFWPPDEQLEMACSAVVPPVTVVLEGRAICHRVHLHEHASYESLALALRRMFVDGDSDGVVGGGLDLSNAVPGHVVAYEDMEDDLLLAGDLDWK